MTADAQDLAPPRSGRNMALQALRGVAACSVMVYHAAHFTALRTGAAWLEQIFSGLLGSYGVLVFFVLSGFLMEAAVRRYDAKTFLLHRFLRLYPSYWLICAAFIIVQSLRAGAFGSIPWRALNLLPLGEMTRPLGVEWTLLYEVFFYAICALTCLWKRAHLPVLLIWFGIVSIAVFRFGQFGTTMQPTLVQIPFSAWNIAFICGGLAGHLGRASRQFDSAALCLVGLVLILLAQLITSVANLFLISPGLALIILGLSQTRAPSGEHQSGMLLRAMFLVGECSYGLYLAHSLGIQIALQYVPAALLSQPTAIFVAMIGVGLALGLVAGTLDITVYQTLKQRIDHRLAVRSRVRIAESQ